MANGDTWSSNAPERKFRLHAELQEVNFPELDVYEILRYALDDKLWTSKSSFQVYSELYIHRYNIIGYDHLFLMYKL